MVIISLHLIAAEYSAIAHSTFHKRQFLQLDITDENFNGT